MHFDDGQYEQVRQDGRKLLRSNAIPNLLKKRTAEKENEDEEDMRKRKKAKYSSHIQDLESHKFYTTQ